MPSLPSDYFDSLYRSSDDPWGISAGWYERRKRELVLASLPRERFGTCFEPGCSNGELTVRLAPRCARIVAWDVVASAVHRTRERTKDCTNVDVRSGALPDGWPDEVAELVVLSEVGYYLGVDDLTRTVAEALEHLTPDGVLVGVHWLHPAPDYPLTGDQVHDLVDNHPGIARLGRYRDEDFVLDVWTNGPAESVARRQGVV